MSASPIAEFQSYRFVRDRNGALAEIPIERRGERQFLVLDCMRYRLARLHIFEGLAGSGETEAAARFQAEIDAVRRMEHPLVTPILSFGRDDTELFIADAFVNGEALGRYLRRTGPMAEAHALDLVLDLLDLLTSRPTLPRTLANFDTGRLQVTADPGRQGRLRLHFNDFTGWTTTAVPNPAELAARLALTLYSLLAGFVFRFPPFSPFQREAAHASAELRSMLIPMLGDDAATRSGFPDLKSLRDTLAAYREGRRESGNEGEARPAEPREFLRDWMLDGVGPVDPGGAYRILGPDPAGAGYAFDAASAKGAAHGRVRFQLFPGWESIPRDGWLEQHLSALRRPGRGLPNQLTVAAVEPWGRCLLIGEERVEGLTLESLIREMGPLDLAHGREIASKVNAALDAIEKTAGAAAVWWLPARNVHLVTGDENTSLLRQAVRVHGTAAWQRLPVRLRLHQTARDLVAGLTFPENILKRIRAGGKAGERGRRATVLLPLLSEMLSGEPFAWDRPVEAHDRLPAPAANLLEQTRLRLLEDPKNIQSWLLDDLSRLMEVNSGKNKSRETPATVTTAEGWVSDPASLFDGLKTGDGGSPPATIPRPAGKLASPFNGLAADLKPFGQLPVGSNTVTARHPIPPAILDSVETPVQPLEAAIVDESLQALEGPALTVDAGKGSVKVGRWFDIFLRPAKKSARETAEPAAEVDSISFDEVAAQAVPEPASVEPAADETPTLDAKPAAHRNWFFFRPGSVPAPADIADPVLAPETGEVETTLAPAEPAPEPVPEEAPPPPRKRFSFRSSQREKTVFLIATETEPEQQPDSSPETETSSEQVPTPASIIAFPTPPPKIVPPPTTEGGAAAPDSPTISIAQAVAALAAAPNPFATPPGSPAPAQLVSDNPFERPVAEVLRGQSSEEATNGAESSPPVEEPADSEPESKQEAVPELDQPKIEATVFDETVPVTPPLPEPPPAVPGTSLVPIQYDSPRGTASEPMSFFAFLKTESQASSLPASGPGLSATPDQSEESTKSAAPANTVSEAIDLPSIGRLFSSSGSSAEMVGANLEETATEAKLERSRTRRQWIARMSRAAALFTGGALVLWGLTYGLVAIAGSVERETVAETLTPLVQTDYLKLAQKDPFSGDERTGTAALPQSTGAAAGIGDAGEAIQIADDARQQGRFADAVNLYLRAIELDPQNGEVRTRLWSAMEAWTSAESEPSPSPEGRIDRAADHAPKAAWLLADYYLDRDRALGLRWLRKSAESGHARHQRLLGLVLSAVPENLPEAVDWFRRSAESGDSGSQLLYGICLLRGRGVEPDANTGAGWVEKAASAGDPRAFDQMGVCFASGLGRDIDQAAAVTWFQRACDAGNSRARYNLAVRYAKGLGVKADKARAAREFQAGADAGDADSMHGLGRCLETGFGVSRDLNAAAGWMRRAAALGHHEALAWCLRQGIDVDSPATEIVARS